MNRYIDESLDFISSNMGICNNCKHKTVSKSTCEAFPKGIPKEILTGKIDHHEPYEGDNGIQFVNTRSPK